MDVKELKFLLKLLSFPNYRAPLSEIQPTPKMRALERNSICQELRDRELVACREEVKNLTIAPPGISLLKMDSTQLPVTPAEIKVLKASSNGTITPGKIKLPSQEREKVIQGLASRGFIKTEIEIKEVWLTPRGQQFLVEEYQSNSTTANITLKMLTDYLRLMRKYQHNLAANANQKQEMSPPVPRAETSLVKPTDLEILQMIRDLDRQLGTDNYLPIFHLWEKLKYSMSKEEFDRTLYRLQREDKIELSSLQEGMNYTPEQLAAGIRLELGGYLFFIIVN